jgi:hypothetical protein
MTEGFRNRVTKLAFVPAQDLKANPDNARRHPATQQNALRGSLDTLGWAAPVIVNERTGLMLDGHARVNEALKVNPAQQIPVAYVDLDETEAAQFLVSFDWITTLAEYDKDYTEALLQRVQSDNENVQAMLADMAETQGLQWDDEPGQDSTNYERKVTAPIHIPSDEKPSTQILCNTTKTDELLRAIQANTSLPDDVRAFLSLAAYRHTVFDYTRIADFYAHSDSEVQRLMEQSALVIVDYDRAIELGFFKAIKELDRLYDDNTPA